MVDYKENATDGDDDGFVQDATPFERPIEKKEEPAAVITDNEPLIPKKKDNKEVTCVISKRNLYLPGVGRLIKGKNEINPDKAAVWLAVEGVEAC